jgi:hypothetical protein
MRTLREYSTELVMTNLSEYVVTAHLREAGKWEAEIRRKDGKEMRVEGTT